MKNFTLIICLALLSCTKSHDLMATKTSAEVMYTLKFEMADEENAVYNIQLSKDGLHFSTIDTLHYNPSKNGIYTYDVSLGSKQLIRVYSVNKQGIIIYSPVVQSN